MLLAPAALNQQLVHADETELQQSSSQSDAEVISKQQNQPNQNSDKDKSTDNKTAANDTNDKKPTADNKSSNANKQSSHNKQTNSALNNKQTTNSAAKNTLSTNNSNQTSRGLNSSNTANTGSVNKIYQNDADKINKPKAKAKASSKKIRKHQQTDDADLDLYLAKPGYTNSIRSQKQPNTKPAVISRKIIYHRASANSDNHQALPQASESLLPVLPNTGFKKSVWQHDNHPITLKSAALGLAACIIFLAAISIPSKRY